MEPKDFFRTLVRRKRTVLTALVVVVGVALFGSMKKLPTYSAACKVRIAAVGPGGSDGQISNDKSRNPTEIYASFEEMTQILESPLMAGAVATRLGVPFGQVAGKISAVHPADTGIFDLTTLYTDPVFAVKMCDAYMTEFLAQRLSIGTEKIEQSKSVLITRKAKYEKELVDTRALVLAAADKFQQDSLKLVEIRIIAEIYDLRSNILDLENALEVGLAGGGEIISHAGTGIKVGPNHKQDAIIGLIVGLIFGAGLALVREYMDDTVRDKESALREIGLTVLASMPPASDGLFGEEDGGSIEAARMLRTNLASQGLGGDVQAVVVTSTLSKRSPSTLVSLAAAIAEAGRTVLVIGADFRQARIHEAFGIGNAVGLTNVIRGQVTFDKAIRPVPGQMGVYVMPTGPVIGNPGELLSTDEMAMVIRRARKWADIVLIDAPPVLAAADASVLGTYADGVLLVMSAGQTLRSQANEAKEQLKAAGSKLLGAVMYGSSDGGQSNGKGMGLATLRRGDDGGMPPLSPYGGFESGGGYDSYGGGYGGGASQGAGQGGGFGSYANADYDEESYDDYDDFDDAPVAPRARSTNGKNKNGRGNGGSTKKRPPAKKSVAASSPARMRMEDREIGRAPRRGTALTLDAREAGSRSGQVKPRPRPKAQNTRSAPAARKVAAPARKAASAGKAAPARKSVSARQAAPARKSVSARKAAPAGKSVSARKSAPARKSSSPRQAPRSNRYDRDLF